MPPRAYKVVLREIFVEDFRQFRDTGIITATVVKKEHEIKDVILLSSEATMSEFYKETDERWAFHWDRDTKDLKKMLRHVTIHGDGEEMFMQIEYKNADAVLRWLTQTQGWVEIGYCQQPVPSLEELRKAKSTPSLSQGSTTTLVDGGDSWSTSDNLKLSEKQPLLNKGDQKRSGGWTKVLPKWIRQAVLH